MWNEPSIDQAGGPKRWKVILSAVNVTDRNNIAHFCANVKAPQKAWELMLRHFADKLHYLRTQRHMTQTDLARLLALARPAHISNLEAGRREPSLSLVVQVAEIFEVTIEHLIRDKQSITDATRYLEQGLLPHKQVAQRFGEKLRFLRTQADLTQVELARQLTLSAHTHISFLESGRKYPSIELVLKIADRFEVTSDYLLRDSLPVDTPSLNSSQIKTD